MDNAVAREALKHYLNGISEVDTIVLGCTHFPVFRDTLIKMVSPDVSIVDSAEATARVLVDLLHHKKLLSDQSSGTAKVNYLVTDSIHRFQKVGALFLGEVLREQDIELVDVKPEGSILL